MDHNEDEVENEGQTALMGFLFGNIDESGNLEDDIFDEESKKHLGGLSALGIGSLIKEWTDETELEQDADVDDILNKSEDVVVKLEDAVDYSDITEAADEEEETEDLISTQNATNEVKEDLTVESSDSELMPPPRWIPATSVTQDSDSLHRPVDMETDEPSEDQTGQNKNKLNTPLATMLPPELADRDVTEWFPEFKAGKVLRFSRLFKPAYQNKLWKRLKKKKMAGQSKDQHESGQTPDNKSNSAKVKTENVKQEVPGVVSNGVLKHEDNGEDSLNVKMEEVENGDQEEMVEGEEEEGVLWINCPFTLNMGREARPEELAVDDKVLMMRMDEGGGESAQKGDGQREQKPRVAEWRYGPAQLWYDMLGVSETGEGFDYGFKLKQKDPSVNKDGEEADMKNTDNAGMEDELPPRGKLEYPEDAFLMVSQVHWEDDVIWNGDDVKQKILSTHKQRAAAAGWLPSSQARTMAQFHQLMATNPTLSSGPSSKLEPMTTSKPLKLSDGSEKEEPFYSIFPIENEALMYERWEDNIIWDAEAMDKIPEPLVLTLDPNDENLILDIPEDCEPIVDGQEPAAKKEKEKKSRFVYGKSGANKDEDEHEPEEETNTIQNKDPFNLSNDEYYNPKLTSENALGRNLGGLIIQHSTPAVELRAPYFPTHLGPMRLRNFHRPPLKKYSHGNMTLPGPQPVLPLLKHIKRKEKLREQERQASGGGEMFFMRTSEDLSCKDGDIILAEYSEEFPPLINQIGMATKIKNYYKRKPGKDLHPPQFKYGELAYAHTSPMLGQLNPGQCLPAFENNMFRAPIYQHVFPHTDFLIIRNRTQVLKSFRLLVDGCSACKLCNSIIAVDGVSYMWAYDQNSEFIRYKRLTLHYSFYIREVESIFVVGQQCPLMEVPGPNSKRANNFVRDFLQVFIYRLFWKSKDQPRRIKMEEIRKAFPTHSESSIRKRLKMCADFKRTGIDSNWWVLKSDFRLPSEEEMRAMVSPEQCCAYYSMLAAEQRLKDAGYGEKSLFAPEDDNEEETQTKIEDEVRAAPWNTTRAYIAAMKGRCLLQLTGVADPTGCGEGFSYVKVPNKPQQKEKDEMMSHTPAKRTVTGTDADLRRLPLKDAKNLLRKFGVPESDINKLKRWQVINVVREMSTEQAKAAAALDGGDEGDVSKFARGNRFSVAEHLDRYKKECNDIFNLQNRMLSSEDVLSTDDESSEGENSDFEEMGKNLENLLSNKKTSSQLSMEREEEERLELKRMLRGEGLPQDKKSKKKDSTDQGTSGIRKLKITRTFHAEDGSEFTRTEIVSKPNVIDIYVRIRETKDPGFIRQFASQLDDHSREEMKKERRRIQEQLRRIKRNEIRDRIQGLHHHEPKSEPEIEPPSPPPAKKFKEDLSEISPSKLVKASKLKCGACGQKGHMRTNKECPHSSKIGPLGLAGSVALSEEQEEELEKSNLIDSDLINVEGTKVIISKQLVEHAEQVKRKSLLLKFPKMAPVPPPTSALKKKQQRRTASTVHCDYLKKPTKPSNRLRADPVVTISSIFESILNEMRELPNVQLFLFPVNLKQVPDYNDVISNPMDLQTIRQNIQGRKYLSREAFLVDVNQIVKNCERYNGPRHALTVASQKMLDFCLQRIAEKEDKLMKLEKKINPLLDDDDLVSFSYILTKIVAKMKAVDQSHPFHTPVNVKAVRDYSNVVTNLMDLSTMEKNCEGHRYMTREQFLKDVELMVSNCHAYNGVESYLGQLVNKLHDVCLLAMKEDEEQLEILEGNILAAQQAAAEAVDTDSVITGTSVAGDLESMDSKSVTRGVEDGALVNEDEEEYESYTAQMQYEDMVNEVNEDVRRRRESHRRDIGADDSLEQDLKVSPENSDEEPDTYAQQQQLDKSDLNLSGSESDVDEQARLSSFSDLVQFGTAPQGQLMFSYDENAQDFAGLASAYVMSADAVMDVGDDEAMKAAAAEYAATATGDSDYEDGCFDPQAFFRSIGSGGANVGEGGGEAQNIHKDLQLSDSDDDDNNSNDDNNIDVDNDDDDDDDDNDFVAVDDNDDSNFDMKEFLK